VFHDDADRESYLAILKTQCGRYGLQAHGFCLMSNHVHLVATPAGDESLARAIGQAHHLYSKAFNKKSGQVGHVWHSRFYSCPLDETHLITALLYVDRNPARAGLVKAPWDWPWSSATAHLGGGDPRGLLDMEWWWSFAQRAGWREIVAQEQTEAELEEIRRHTQTGRPLGNEEFVKRIERRLGYPVQLRSRGRPRVGK
jgi:putative transposase